MSASHRLQSYIEGDYHASAGESLEIINPSNGRPCGRLPAGSETDVDDAVRSGQSAFQSGCWRKMPPSERKAVLYRWADLVVEHAALLDSADAREMGKPIAVTLGNARAAANLLRFHAEAIGKIEGGVYSSDQHSFWAQRWLPRGVVGAVVPWNFPTYNALLKLAPALAAGNSVVLKPSELAPSSALHLAGLATRAGMPLGVFNAVLGCGSVVGKALALHPGIDMVAFTGSTSVGKLIIQYSAQSNLKPVVAECGGKSPHIVFDDGVDLDDAAKAIATFLLTNQGQICSVGSRLLVQRSIESALIDRIQAHMSKVVIGDASHDETTFGPIASKGQYERILQFIGGAAAEGAELVHGGRPVLSESGGFFLEPALFRNVRPGARLAQEEIFGPVLAVTAFDDEAAAIELANSTPYGLSAYVWTTRIGTGMRLADELRSAIHVNTIPPRGEGAGHAASLEPTGESGIGVEGGIGGIKSYMRQQRLALNYPAATPL